MKKKYCNIPNTYITDRNGNDTKLKYLCDVVSPHNLRRVQVECYCGKTFECYLQGILKGQTTSCGCYHRKIASEVLRKASIGRIFNRKQLPLGFRDGDLEIIDYYGTENRIFYYRVLNHKTKNILKLSRKGFLNRTINRVIYLGRASVRNALRVTGYTKTEQTLSYLGCSYNELLKHLGRMPNGLEEIDHICPVSQARSEEEVRKLCNFKNLRIITREENKLKSNKKTTEAEKMCKILLNREWID